MLRRSLEHNPRLLQQTYLTESSNYTGNSHHSDEKLTRSCLSLQNQGQIHHLLVYLPYGPYLGQNDKESSCGLVPPSTDGEFP